MKQAPLFTVVDLENVELEDLDETATTHPIDYLACADLHLTSRRPPCRTDVCLWENLEAKLQQINMLADIYDTSIICAGDIFDVALADKQAEHLALRQLSKQSWITLPGNHDMPQHNASLLWEASYSLLHYNDIETGLDGADWDTDYYVVSLVGDVVSLAADVFVGLVPFGFKPFSPDKNVEILATHILTWPGDEREPFPGASDEGVSAQQLLDDNPAARIIVTGDNHASFIHRDIHDPSRVLINPGSLWRRRKDQRDHRPSVYGFQVETGNVVRFLLDVAPAEEVMRPDSDAQTVKVKKKPDSGTPLIVADRIDAGTTFKGLMSALEQDVAKDYDYPQRLRSAATRMGDDDESKRAKELLLEEVEKLQSS